MIKIKKSGAKYSAIVAISEQLKELKNNGENILFLNRGINAVVPIDLSRVIPLIDFNSPAIQVYPHNKGLLSLRKAINNSFFLDTSNENNIIVTNGGMNALSLIFRTLLIDKVWVSASYWGAYLNILKIEQQQYDFYPDFNFLETNLDKLNNTAVIICDPNNPLGNKYPDDQLLKLIHKLEQAGVIVIWDSPYRKLFIDWEKDDFYVKLLKLNNVIISESFSKSVGLSGQRIGFVHSTNQEFMDELNINLLYATNGINGFSQVLIEKLLTSPEGKKAEDEFKSKTVDGIKQNIDFLKQKNLLVSEYYQSAIPVGIFVIVNKLSEELLKYGIGSVPFGYFSILPEKEANKYSRICVSVPHDDFVSFFSEI